MHICYISQEYPPETGWGGVGSYTYEMAHGMVKRGHRVTIISLAVGDEKTENDAEVVVHRVKPYPDFNSLKGLWRMNKIWPGFAWAAALKLKKIQGNSRIDIVEAGECRADSLFIPYFTKIKVVVRLHLAHIFIDRLNGVTPDNNKKIKYWMEKKVILDADSISAPSLAVVNLTNQWIKVIEKRHIRIIPNPINPHFFSPQKQNGIDGQIIFVGRLERNKGAHIILQVMPLVLNKSASAVFRIIGADSTDADGISWQQKIRESLTMVDNSRISFEELSRKQIVDLYNSSAIFIMPSIWENSPYALLEAMSCAVPIIATNVGGIPEIVQHMISGLLVEPESPINLANAIITLVADQDLRKKMGAQARERILNSFSIDQVLPKMESFYYDILADKRKIS